MLRRITIEIERQPKIALPLDESETTVTMRITHDVAPAVAARSCGSAGRRSSSRVRNGRRGDLPSARGARDRFRAARHRARIGDGRAAYVAATMFGLVERIVPAGEPRRSCTCCRTCARSDGCTSG